MKTSERIIRFQENGTVREVHSSVQQLKRVHDKEYLITGCGLRIVLDNILSVNGVSFA